MMPGKIRLPKNTVLEADLKFKIIQVDGFVCYSILLLLYVCGCTKIFDEYRMKSCTNAGVRKMCNRIYPVPCIFSRAHPYANLYG